MKSVWVLFDNNYYHGPCFKAVFATREGAEAARRKLREDAQTDFYLIEEHELGLQPSVGPSKPLQGRGR